jgi:hypothetical protein
MLAILHQVRHGVAWNTSYNFDKRNGVYHCYAGPQKLVSDVDGFVYDDLSVPYRGQSDKLYSAVRSHLQ